MATSGHGATRTPVRKTYNNFRLAQHNVLFVITCKYIKIINNLWLPKQNFGLKNLKQTFLLTSKNHELMAKVTRFIFTDRNTIQLKTQ
jgi:hypothetical protein